ncbi:putative cleavage and polyadenylation specificity factor subunit 4-like protein [Smittium mucronatum]|uniref:Putative cleavage and polyadenylation specificity factor subunit 4-like protein n=1 Tax=Smittium mucronatum TaxID=133383 RepID=A0A1R0GP67_9FUNG|nr:putative cleavage and polyadenylation specificity factor subunit 4-like protein [Smittium mucronatum]
MATLELLLEDLDLDSDLVNKYVNAALEDSSMSSREKEETIREYLMNGDFQAESKINSIVKKILLIYSERGTLNKRKEVAPPRLERPVRMGLSFNKRAQRDVALTKPVVFLPNPSLPTAEEEISPLPETDQKAIDTVLLAALREKKYSEGFVENDSSTSQNYSFDTNTPYPEMVGNGAYPEYVPVSDALHHKTLDLVDSDDITLTDFEILNTIFEIIDADVIWEAFLVTEFDPLAVLNLLLIVDVKSLTFQTHQQQQQQQQQQQLASKRVCKYYMKGECYRSDCWYSHDLGLLICKFWLKGTCIKDHKCEFLHEWPINIVSAITRESDFLSSEVSTKKMEPRCSPPPLTSSEFPSLFSNQTSNSKTRSRTNNLKSKKKGAKRPSISETKRASMQENVAPKAPVKSTSPISNVTAKALGKSSSPQSKSIIKPPGKLTALKPTTKEFIPQTRMSPQTLINGKIRMGTDSPFMPAAETRFNMKRFHELPKINPLTHPEHQSFKRFYELYNEAVILAGQRNVSLKEAGSKYMLSGDSNSTQEQDKEMISEAVKRTLDLNTQVHKAYLKASEELFYASLEHSRGSSSISDSDGGKVYIYLYGLAGEEAISLLASRLNEAEFDHCFIITNKLKTPTNKTSQLTAEVLEFLEKSNYRFKNLNKDGQMGIFGVIVDVVKIS